MDVLWQDIDYMVKKIDFSINEKLYPMEAFHDVLERFKIRYVPIIDAGVHVPESIISKTKVVINFIYLFYSYKEKTSMKIYLHKKNKDMI